jgi:hypothetical protein
LLRENAKLKAAKKIYRTAKNEHFTNTYLSPEVGAAHDKLARESYGGRGAGIGAAAGGIGGVAAGIGIARKISKRVGAEGLSPLPVIGGIEGLILGAGAGMNVGHRIRRKQPAAA